MHLAEVAVEQFRGWKGPVTWRPGETAVLVGPNSGGKTSLLQAVDIVLDPHRDAYRNRLTEHDYFDLDTSKPVQVTLVLAGLSADDLDHFEACLEGRRADGSFGGWDSPQDEFDQGDVVLRVGFRGEFGAPARAFFLRPECGEAPVHQADKVRIGWRYVAADLNPLHGRRSPGVKRQYSGTLGKIGSCQIAVSLHVVSTKGTVPLGFRLYVPEDWCADPVRRREAEDPSRADVSHQACARW